MVFGGVLVLKAEGQKKMMKMMMVAAPCISEMVVIMAVMNGE